MLITKMMKSCVLYSLIAAFFAIVFISCEAEKKKSVFAKDNLMAWCIVPYDAELRGPWERAEMLNELGVTMLAYDWRAQHVPTFDEEWKALTHYGIRLQAFWMMTGKDPQNDQFVQAIFDFLERNEVKTEIWLYVDEGENFDSLSETEKVTEMAVPVRYVAERAASLGCKVGLYNHGGWYGEPENQLALLKHIDLPNIGLVYNFHHARFHHARFAEFFPTIVPYLYAVNLAGLKAGDTDLFYGIGEGDVEAAMIEIVANSGYEGPIGILNHDRERDAKAGLQHEMKGLQAVLKNLGDEHALQTYRTPSTK